MVNHFASLLGNIKLVEQKLAPVASVLGDTDEDPDIQLSLDGSAFFSLDESYISLKYVKASSNLVARNYVVMALPRELLKFRELLFPPSSSTYYQHFLLYSYLRLLAGTPMAPIVTQYDSRITYNLKEIQDYYRFYRNSAVVSSDKNYQLHLSGKLKPDEQLNYYLNNFVVRQVGTSSEVLIFSTTQGLYYGDEVAPSPISENMEQLLTINQVTRTSNIIKIGLTGLSFFISGPFDSLDSGFDSKNSRTWAFTSETPFIFDFNNTMELLENHPQIIDSMLAYRRDSCDTSHENLWKSHYNSVYRFVGLLMAYVNRVHLLWLQQTSE